MWQRFTERARRAVFFAQEEAGRRQENQVSPEYLLLGLLREDDTVATVALQRMGVSLSGIRQDTEKLLSQGHAKSGKDMVLTKLARDVVALSGKEADSLASDCIGTEHMLLAIIREADSPAARVLAALKADYSTTKDVIMQIQGKHTDETRPTPWSNNSLAGGDLLGIDQLSREQIDALLGLAIKLKNKIISAADQRKTLEGKTLAMIFEKPSLRTRVTFETGIFQLGGHGIYLAPADIQLGKRESIADVARNLDRWVDIIMARVFAHSTVLELAEYAKHPVINGLCDMEHPCQALADFQTILEHKGKLEGLKLAFIGDGNNVAHSLMLMAAKVGMNFAIGCPQGYEPDAGVVANAKAAAEATGAAIEITNDPKAAVDGADVVYTDVWASMGQEAEAAARATVFESFQVNSALMSLAKSDAIFEHCLPAHRGSEVTDEVIDSPQSVVFDEAENRLHAQKAVMVMLGSGEQRAES